MATTLPSNLYDPVLALEYVDYQFYQNLSLFQRLMRIEGHPGQMYDDRGLPINPPKAPITFNPSKALLESGGTYLHAPTFNPMTTLESQRDQTSSSDATPIGISSRDDIGVRINRKLGPVSFTKSAQWMSGLVGGQLEAFFAREAVRWMFYSLRQFILAAVKAAILNMTDSGHTVNVYGAANRTNLTTQLLASIKATLSDRQDLFSPDSGSGWAFHPNALNSDLIPYQMGQGVRGIADRVQDGGNPLIMGLNMVEAADPALRVMNSSNFYEYFTLLLGPGCIELDLIRFEFTPLWMNPKAENVEFILRGDYDAELRIMGFKWDTAGGGANPTLATVGTNAYWIVNYTDDREVPMAVGEHNSSVD